MKHKFEIKATTVEGFESSYTPPSMKDLANDPPITTNEFNIDSECLITVIGDHSLEHSLIIPASALIAQTSIWLPLYHPCRRLEQIPEEVEMPRVYVTVRQLTGLSPVTERQEVSEISIEEYDLFGSPSSFIKRFDYTTFEENTVGEKDYLKGKVEDLESAMHSMQINQAEKEKELKLENLKIKNRWEEERIEYEKNLGEVEMVYKNQLHTAALKAEKLRLELMEKTQSVQTQAKQIQLHEITLSNETKRREALEAVLLETRNNYQEYLNSTKERDNEIAECIMQKDQIIATLQQEAVCSKQYAREAVAEKEQLNEEVQKLKIELEFYKIKSESHSDERLAESENRRIELHNALQELTSRLFDKPSSSYNPDSDKENAQLKQQISDLNHLLNLEEAKYSTLMTELRLVKEQYASQSSSPLNQSLLEQISDLNSQLADLQSENMSYKSQLTDLQVQISKYREVVNELKSTLEKQSIENTELSSKLGEALSKLPTEEKAMDSIDQLLKDYMHVNNIKNPFVRISEGLYTFGNKRLSVAVRNGMPVVRVGGGYMFVEEFLKIYIGKNLKRKPDDNDSIIASPLATPRSRSSSQGPDMKMHKRYNTVTVMVSPFEASGVEVNKLASMDCSKMLSDIQNIEPRKELDKSKESLKKGNSAITKKPSVSPKRTRVSQKQVIKPLKLSKASLTKR
jgi:hypothetical protein